MLHPDELNPSRGYLKKIKPIVLVQPSLWKNYIAYYLVCVTSDIFLPKWWYNHSYFFSTGNPNRIINVTHKYIISSWSPLGFAHNYVPTTQRYRNCKRKYMKYLTSYDSPMLSIRKCKVLRSNPQNSMLKGTVCIPICSESQTAHGIVHTYALWYHCTFSLFLFKIWTMLNNAAPCYAYRAYVLKHNLVLPYFYNYNWFWLRDERSFYLLYLNISFPSKR